MLEILERHYPKEAICPIHGYIVRDNFERFTATEHATWQLVRGHMRVGSYSLTHRFITQTPICVTMLREPMTRIVSAYRYILRQPDHPLYEEFVRDKVSLLEYLTNPRYAYLPFNYQTFMVAGAVRGNIQKEIKSPLSDAARLALAKQRLEQYAFVGLTERYAESAALLAYTFGWEPVTELPEVNKAPTQTHLEHLDAATLAALEACTELDRALYQYATELFEARYQQMQDML